MNQRLYVGTRKGLFTLERQTNGHYSLGTVAFLGDPITMMLSDPRDGALYAAVGHGHFGAKLHRSRDAGSTWNECATPKYPPKPDGLVELDPIRNTPIPWSVDTVWSMETGGADEPGALWLGTIPGGLFKSPDGGDTWALARTLWDDPLRPRWSGGGADFAGIHSICVDPRDARHLTVAVSTGGLWQTTDGGESWRNIGRGLRNAYMPPDLWHDPVAQDVHRLVRCPAQPDALWIQHHNGIFRSRDNAQNWTEIEAAPSSFGFAVAVHPRDGNTAYFVPAKKDQWRVPVDAQVVVTRTRDGGQTFESLRKGLPQEHAYDLVYRHGLDIDATGDRLAFGSTTGSLWVTDNEGADWHAVSHHLPPIYCVRFGR